jgi:very-short-patch-repair endonuclease
VNVQVHRSELPVAHITEQLSIPVTTVARTLADLASQVSLEVLGIATDDALRRRLLDVHELEGLRVGRVGRKAFGQVVSRRLAEPPGESVAEDRVYRWLVDAGLPAPVRQHRVVLPTAVVVLDMAYPEERVGIEFDGFEWHKGRRSFDRDRERHSELAVAGWRIITVTSAHPKPDVIDRVRRALDAPVAPQRGRH